MTIQGNIKFKIGSTISVMDKDSGETCMATVVREISREEFLDSGSDDPCFDRSAAELLRRKYYYQLAPD